MPKVSRVFRDSLLKTQESSRTDLLAAGQGRAGQGRAGQAIGVKKPILLLRSGVTGRIHAFRGLGV